VGAAVDLREDSTRTRRIVEMRRCKGIVEGSRRPRADIWGTFLSVRRKFNGS
jgi:hypothetical protein